MFQPGQESHKTMLDSQLLSMTAGMLSYIWSRLNFVGIVLTA